jgi:hypothetical protein
MPSYALTDLGNRLRPFPQSPHSLRVGVESPSRTIRNEAELTASVWERHRELHGRIEELKGKCKEAAHSLTVVLAGSVGTRQRLMRNGRNQPRTCIICRARLRMLHFA